MINEKDLLLYFIMGSDNTKRNPSQVLQEAIDGGVTIFQYREKGLHVKKGEDKIQLGKQLRKICQEKGVPFIVNDDIDLAIQLGADGVHLGQGDEPIKEAREKLPNTFPIGISVSTIEEAVLAEQQGASYLGVGPIFETATKPGKKPIGIQTIRDITEKVNIPIVAIGGVKKSNAMQIKKAGAAGISVITAISQAGDAEQAARELREQLDKVQ
ncbi:thiamine phosphate synthase [Virgibacillus alimentarius]|uniref:thiamine phosphate synthase n=1 Tax=Virgibacillus alimentarius TaxID=698769 RepID=UPI000493728E|nr:MULTISPECIES: thiamine phosphate synthase [Virgibacillus]HLR67940.1 thiamine phosphate synthase [Virgibacillus sp.]